MKDFFDFSYKAEVKRRRVSGVQRIKKSKSFMLFCQSKREHESLPRRECKTFREVKFGLGVSHPEKDLKFTVFLR